MVSPVEFDYYFGESEQALIETQYIKAANDLIGNALSGLQQAIGISTQVLQTLNALQLEKNKLTVETREVPTDYPSDQEDYIEFASENFGKPIVPELRDDFDAAAIEDLRDQLQDQLDALAPFVDVDDPNGIYQTGLRVIQDIDDAGPEGWVMDRYDVVDSSAESSDAGAYQNNLSLAMTASQSLSDTQKEQVRRYLFIFEEYYKSAGAMLNKITSIIERMAQNIARG